MQTLILINPVAAPPRPESWASDSGTTESPDSFFADVMAGIVDRPPARDPVESLSDAVVFIAPPETVPPLGFEPMGAVQGLAEAAAMPKEAFEGDLPGPEIPGPEAPFQGVLSADIAPAAVARPSQSVDLAPAAVMGVIAQPRLPEDVALTSAGPEVHGFSAVNLPDQSLSATSISNLLHLPAIADGSLPVAQIFLRSLSDRPAAQTASQVKPSTLAVNMQSPPLTITSADASSQPDGEGGPRTALPVESVMARAMAKLALALPQTPAPAIVTGTVLVWQAGLLAEMDQSESSEQPAGTDPVSAAAHNRDSSAVLFRPEGQVAPTFQWADNLVPALPVLAQFYDLDLDVEAILAIGTVPTHSSTLGGVGHPSASVSLQDLPRLAAQLAGTLVHRADRQTDVAFSPEELGHVRLTMQADAQNPDRIVVMLTFDRPETLDLFRRHADQLADALREAGYSGADISFGRSGGENARDGSDPDRPAPDQQGATSFGRDITPLHHPSKPAATGSLDLRL